MYEFASARGFGSLGGLFYQSLKFMRLPRLDPDDRGNEHLHALLRRIDPKDVAAFLEKLTNLSLRPRLHAYRELLVGSHLRDRGFDVRYEQRIRCKTPDWSLIKSDGSPLELVDVLTLEQRHDKRIEITSAIKSNKRWSGWITVPRDHIYRKLNDKAGQYSVLVREEGVPYVLAMYGEFIASVDPRDVERVLFEQHGGWFSATPGVSGLIYCRETNFEVEYTYFENPYASYRSSFIPGGLRG